MITGNTNLLLEQKGFYTGSHELQDEQNPKQLKVTQKLGRG